MKKIIKQIIKCTLLITLFSYANSVKASNPVHISSHYFMPSWEATSSSQDFDADGSGFIISLDYGKPWGLFGGVSYFYASGDADYFVGSPVNTTITGSLSSSGLIFDAGVRYPLSEALWVSTSIGTSINTIDVSGFIFSGQSLLNDDNRATSMHWKLSVLYNLSSNGIVELSYHDFSSNDLSWEGTNEPIDVSLSGISLGYKISL